jgi:hypothetical protein
MAAAAYVKPVLAVRKRENAAFFAFSFSTKVRLNASRHFNTYEEA